MIRFEVNREYEYESLYSGYVTVRVVERTKTTVRFEGDETPREIIMQNAVTYDENFNPVSEEPVETALMWTYCPMYAAPDDIKFGYVFADSARPAR